MNCPGFVKEAIPTEASTIHRLFGTIPDSPYFQHNERNSLPFDIVVVDEGSMVDLALMSKLFQAFDTQARLILLGDKDQLASVEAGAVFGISVIEVDNTSFHIPFLKVSKKFCRMSCPLRRMNKRNRYSVTVSSHSRKVIVLRRRSERMSGLRDALWGRH